MCCAPARAEILAGESTVTLSACAREKGRGCPLRNVLKYASGSQVDTGEERRSDIDLTAKSIEHLEQECRDCHRTRDCAKSLMESRGVRLD